MKLWGWLWGVSYAWIANIKKFNFKLKIKVADYIENYTIGTKTVEQ